MMKFLRSQSQTVLIVVLAILGFGFLFYGNAGNLLTTSSGARGHGDYGRIDGTDLSVAELYDAIHNARDTFIIKGHGEDLEQPGARAQIAEEAWRQLLLLHEADRLHVDITNKQMVEFVQNMPAFQNKSGVYDPEQYKKLMAGLQSNYHISPDTFANVLMNNLRIDAVRNALLSSVRASSQEIAAQYEKYYGPAQITVVTFDPKSFSETAKVTPEEVETEYKNHPENPAYRTAEKRKVDYVLFELTPEQAKLPEDDKTRAIAKDALGQKALDFAQSLQPDPTAPANTPPADFLAGAKKQNLKSGTTDFFTPESSPAGVTPSPAFNSAAFELNKDNPISKVVEMANGVAVLHLVEIQPSNLRPLDEVKPEIVKSLQQTRGMLAQQIAVQSAAQSLKDAVAKGIDFKAAAAALHLKTESLPAFVPVESSEKDMRLRTIAYAATTIPVGGVSEPIPNQADNSVYIVHLDGRTKADPAKLEKFVTQFRDREEQRLRSYVYVDWATWRTKRPGTHKPPELERYAAVAE